MSKHTGSSQSLATKLLRGEIPRVPACYFPLADVRDVADAHVLGLKAEGGKRYAITENTYKMQQVTEILSKEFNPMGYKVSQIELIA